MSDGQSLTRQSRNVEIVGYPEFVNRQLGKVTRQVQAGELLAALLGWLTLMGLGLIAAILWDHWVNDVGFWGRSLAACVWLGFAGWLFWRRVVPPLSRRVSRAYAAKVVEDAEPGLKNSLINLVFLRQRHQQANEVVLRELEQQTATRLTSVDVEASVDRSAMIRWLAALSSIIVLAAAYAVFSPKSTMDSVRRLFVPWSQTPRPSRVRIVDVQPGSTTAFHGRFLDIWATIENLRDGDSVSMVYSTADRQAVQRRAPMSPPQDPARFEARLPQEVSGATSDMSYYVEAGDAIAGPFEVKVLELPSAVIEHVRYEYPAYTQQEPKQTQRQGDIHAIEGTKVSWKIRTNHPIERAYLEFDPEPESGEINSLDQRWPLVHEDQTAHGSYTLTLKPDRHTPTHESYQIRFGNQTGILNPAPVIHRIQVVRDLPPEVAILTPVSRDSQVAENGTFEIEIRGVDPDFALANIRLLGLAHGRQVLERALLDQELSGQVIRRHTLRPSELGLVAGDTLIFWAEATDNRHDPVSQAAAPNVARTIQYRLLILPPGEEAQNDENRDDEKAADTGSPDDEAGDGEQGGEQTESQDSAADDGGAMSDETDQSDPSDAAGSDEQETGESKNQDNQSDSAAGERDSSSSNSESNGGESGSETDSAQPGESEATDSPTEEASGDRSASRTSDDQQTDDRESPADATGRSADQSGENRQQRSTPLSEREDNMDSSEVEEPVPHDGSRDGDAFERILEQIKQSRNSDGDESAEDRGGGQPPDQTEEPEPTDQPRPSEDESQGDDQTRTENRDGRPEDRDKRPEDRDGQPEDRDRQPEDQDRDGQPEDRDGQPEDRDGQPEDRDGQPEDRDGQPEDRDGQPEDRDGQPEDRDGQPESRDGQPESRDGQPESRDGQPEGRDGQAGDAENGEGRPETEPGAQSPDGSKSANGRAGSEAAEGQSGDSPDSQADSDASGEPDDQGSSSGESGQGSPSENGSGDSGATDSGESSASSNSTMGGSEAAEADGAASQGSADGRAPNDQPDGDRDFEDEANLEYARKATDLALEYLEDQDTNPDPELLERLGWTAQELRQFVQRWKQMREAAQQTGQTGQRARRDLDDILQSLGLSPQQDQLDSRRRQDQRVEGIREDGGRSEPPPEYRDRYRAYLKSRQTTSNANED